MRSHALHPGTIQGKEGVKFRHLATLIKVETIKVSDFKPDPELAEEVKKAYAILDPLAKTELTTVPERFRDPIQ